MNESIERMRKLVNDNLVMGLRFQMNRELNKLESEIEQELNSRAERTCRIEGRYGNQYCTCCGEMVGTWDSTSELYIDGNMVELWNYCPNCGARVVE